MYKIKNNIINEIEIEKSKFITYLFRIDSEDEARDYLNQVRKEHPNANHHCYGYIINNHQKSSDDKEPSGTAGVPIMNALTKAEITNCLAIVVRYFGGIKLGTGGLIRAYGNSVSKALAKAALVRKVLTQLKEITFNYDAIGKIEYLMHQNNLPILKQKFEEQVTYQYYNLVDIDKELNNLTNGNIKITTLKEVCIEQDI